MWIFLLLFICVNSSNCVTANNDSMDRLISVIQIFRHGQRTPSRFYHNDPYQNRSFWNEDPGQLDSNGKIEIYDLGKFTRQRYDGFLPREYNKPDFYIQSTDTDRTLMSAMCYVAGLYGPGTRNESLLWQPIPIHPDTAKLEDTECKSHLPLSRLLESTEEYFKSLGKQNKDTYEYLTQHTGQNISDIVDTMRLHDTLLIEELYGFTLPNWTRQVYPDVLKRIAGTGFQMTSYNDRLKKLCLGPFLREAIHHFEKILQNPESCLKLRVYSAHDINIGCMLDIVGTSMPFPPLFASSIYIELRKKNDSDVVNIWHKNGNDFKQVAPKNCTLDCPFDTFKVMVSRYFIEEDEYDLICNNNVKVKAGNADKMCMGYTEGYFYLVTVVLIVFGCALGIRLILNKVLYYFHRVQI